MTLGPLDMGAESNEAPVPGAPMSLAGARQLAATALRAKASGIDPAAERRKAERVPDTLSFPDLVTAYLAHIEKSNRSWKGTASVLLGIASEWKGPLDSYDRSAVREMVERCRREGVPGRKCWRQGASEARARLVHVTLARLFGWAIEQGKCERSPCMGLKAPPPSRGRERVLSDAEIKSIWNALPKVASPPHVGAIRLLFTTGLRLREAGGLR
jgi:integrase